MKGDGTTDVAITYSEERYQNYYFGSRKQDLENRFQSLNLFLEHGFSDSLDMVLVLPYIRTKACMGCNDFNQGLQDAMLWLKYRNQQKSLQFKELSVISAVGISFPASGYEVEIERPIGVRAYTFMARILAQLKGESGWFGQLNSGLDFRIRPSQQFALPVLGRVGYAGSKIFFEGFFEYFQTFNSGIDQQILGGEGSTWVKAGVSIYKPFAHNLGFTVGGAWVPWGRNIGQSVRVNLGLVFRYSSKK